MTIVFVSSDKVVAACETNGLRRRLGVYRSLEIFRERRGVDHRSAVVELIDRMYLKDFRVPGEGAWRPASSVILSRRDGDGELRNHRVMKNNHDIDDRARPLFTIAHAALCDNDGRGRNRGCRKPRRFNV